MRLCQGQHEGSALISPKYTTVHVRQSGDSNCGAASRNTQLTMCICVREVYHRDGSGREGSRAQVEMEELASGRQIARHSVTAQLRLASTGVG